MKSLNYREVMHPAKVFADHANCGIGAVDSGAILTGQMAEWIECLICKLGFNGIVSKTVRSLCNLLDELTSANEIVFKP